jgi:hypothetical protein
MQHPGRVRGYHPLWPALPDRSAAKHRTTSPALQPRRDVSRRFRLFRVRSPLLTESRFLSFPRGTEMFQFPPFASHAYGFSMGSFRDPGINARLTAPPGLSQSSTPFIASWRQDIPHTPLVAWPHRPQAPVKRRNVQRIPKTRPRHRPSTRQPDPQANPRSSQRRRAQ